MAMTSVKGQSIFLRRYDTSLQNSLQQELFYMHHPTDMPAHTTTFVIPVVENLLGRAGKHDYTRVAVSLRNSPREILYKHLTNTFSFETLFKLWISCENTLLNYSYSAYFKHIAKKRFTEEHREGKNEMFYLTTHLTHFFYGYIASDI